MQPGVDLEQDPVGRLRHHLQEVLQEEQAVPLFAALDEAAEQLSLLVELGGGEDSPVAPSVQPATTLEEGRAGEGEAPSGAEEAAHQRARAELAVTDLQG